MMERIDLLSRDVFIDSVMQLVKQLSDIKKGCCFAIEGKWGIGKTFVLEEIEKRLDAVEGDNYFVLHYNCWQHDYYNEPAVAIISAMLSSIQKDKIVANEDIEQTIKAGYDILFEKLREIAGIYLENKIGVNVVEMIKEVGETKEKNEKVVHEFDKMFNFSQTIEKVRKCLQETAKKRTIVLIVDELDRCIPEYAIKVLERLHHIFYGLDNIIVILAIDRMQLEHSVENMFGIKEGSIDIEKYLKKFIDFSMLLNCGEINESITEKYKFYFEKFDECGNTQDMDNLRELLLELLRDIDIRRQEKLFDKANIVHAMVCDEAVDLSVLMFEILYEVLLLWRVDDMSFLAQINSASFIEVEEKIGKEKIELLKVMEEEAVYNRTESGKGVLINNLYGKVCWYFANIFNEDNIPYYMPEGSNWEEQLEIIKKYCKICKVIK